MLLTLFMEMSNAAVTCVGLAKLGVCLHYSEVSLWSHEKGRNFRPDDNISSIDPNWHKLFEFLRFFNTLKTVYFIYMITFKVDNR